MTQGWQRRSTPLLFVAFVLPNLTPALRSQELELRRAVANPADGAAAATAVTTILRNELHASQSDQLARLLELGEPAIPACFARLAGLSIEGDSVAEGIDSTTGGPSEPPPDHQLLLHALRSFPESAVDEFLRGAIALAPELRDTLAIMRVSGELGRAASLALLQSAMAGLDPRFHGHPVVAGTLRNALAAILAGDRTARGDLERFLLALPPAFATCTIEAIRAADRDLASALSARLLGRQPELDRVLLEDLERHPPQRARDGFAMAEVLRKLSASETAAVHRASSYSLRRFADVLSARALIVRLGDTDERVRKVAHRSLLEMSGVALGNSTKEWLDWVNAEVSWLAGPGSEWVGALDSDNVAEVLQALGSLARKKIHADVFAAPIGAVLRHRKLELRLAACEALARLGTLACREELATVLDDRDPQVAALAARLLGRSGVTR